MTKKLKYVIADAVVVINAHEENYWEALCNTYQVVLPGIVLEDEVFYFQSDKGRKGLNPSEWISKGMITRIDAEIKDYDTINKRLSKDFMAGLDAGEREALAILTAKNYQQLLFATADRTAIKALGVLGMGNRGISVEELLDGLGSGSAKKAKLSKHFTKEWFQKYKIEGFSEQHLWLQDTCKVDL